MFFEVSFAEKSVILLRRMKTETSIVLSSVSFAEKSVILLRPQKPPCALPCFSVSFAEKSVILLRPVPALGFCNNDEFHLLKNLLYC